MKHLLNRALSLLLTASLLLGCAPWAYAVDVEEAISFVTPNESAFTYRDNGDGTCTVTGYTGEDLAIAFPETLGGLSVTVLGESAFQFTKLTAVAIPDTVAVIEPHAFNYCSSLTTVDFPASLQEIAYNAFRGCALSEVDLPETKLPLKIGSAAFSRIDTEMTLRLPANLDTSEASSGLFEDSNVIHVELKGNWTAIPENLFADIGTLTAITLPETVTEIGYGAFDGCTGLTSVNIPSGVTVIPNYAFRACMSLQSVTLPEGLTEIGNEAFSNCALTAVEFPTSLQFITDRAFFNCDKLTRIVLPEGLQSLGSQAFGSIAAPLAVHIPSTLTNTYYPFQYADLTEVTFAPGFTEIPTSLFGNADEMTAITLPEGLLTIGSYAFAGCESLAELTIPDSVTTIYSNAFEECASLTELELPDGLKELYNDVFTDCTGLELLTCLAEDAWIDSDALRNIGAVPTVCTTFNSVLGTYAVANGLPVQLVYTGREHTWLDGDACRIYSTVGAGCASISIDYAVAADQLEIVTPDSMEIYIPQSILLREMDGILLNGEGVDYQYDEWSRILTVDISGQPRGTIRFTGRIQDSGSLNLYARFHGTAQQDDVTEVVGYLLDKTPAVSIRVPDHVGSDFTANGIAPAGSQVTLTIDGSPAASVQTNALGRWTADLTLDAEDNSIHTVTASADGASDSAQVCYGNGTPTLTKLELINGGSLDLTKNNSPVISLNPNLPFTFVVEFENGEQIDQVFVNSHRGGKTSSLEAVYDAAYHRYIATGYFEANLPGNISVSYTTKQDPFSITQCRTAAEAIQDAVSEDVTITETALSDALDTLPAGMSFKEGRQITLQLPADSGARAAIVPMTFSIETYSISNPSVSVSMNPVVPVSSQVRIRNSSVSVCYNTVRSPLLTAGTPAVSDSGWLRFTTKDSDGKIYNISCKSSAFQENGSAAEDRIEDFVVFVEDVSNSEITRFVLDGAAHGMMDADALLDALDNAGALYEGLELLYEQHKIKKDHEELVKEIRRNMHGTEQIKALRKAEELKRNRQDFSLATAALGGYLAMAGVMAGPAGLVMGGLLMALSVASEMAWEARMEAILGGEFLPQWLIDPSGYVYEAVPANRLEGVTTTAYWIPEDPEDAAFWDVTPTAAVTDEGVQLWNAEEYNQRNPLTTDSEGRYAWDVPAGWWRVQYELEGYETTYSDWLPVPPPQLEVNVGMVSTAAPEIEAVEAEAQQIVVTFSKYMQPDTVKNALTLNGQATGFTVTAAEEAAADGVTSYARSFTLTPETPLADGAPVSITVSDSARSYADTAADEQTVHTTVGGAPRLEVPETLELYYRETVTLPITVENVDDPQIQLQSQLPLIASAAGGTLTGNLPGTTTVRVSLNGTNLVQDVTVTVLYRPITIFSADVEGSVTEEGVGVTVTLANSTEEDVTETYICAAYDGNQKMLDHFMVRDITTRAGTNQQLTDLFPTETVHLKLFRLDGDFCPVEHPAETDIDP